MRPWWWTRGGPPAACSPATAEPPSSRPETPAPAPPRRGPAAATRRDPTRPPTRREEGRRRCEATPENPACPIGGEAPRPAPEAPPDVIPREDPPWSGTTSNVRVSCRESVAVQPTRTESARRRHRPGPSRRGRLAGG